MKNENPRFCRANASYSFILLTNGLSDNKPSWKMGWRHSGGRSGQAAKPYSKLGIINRLFADGVNPIRTTPSVQPHPYSRASSAREAGYQSRRVSQLCDSGEEST